MRGKEEFGLDTVTRTRSYSEPTTTGATCGSGECDCDGEVGISSAETLSAESGSTTLLSFKKFEFEMQESGTE